MKDGKLFGFCFMFLVVVVFMLASVCFESMLAISIMSLTVPSLIMCLFDLSVTIMSEPVRGATRRTMA